MPGEVHHHERCLVCGQNILSSTKRGLITARHKHRKTKCPTAEFERIGPDH